MLHQLNQAISAQAGVATWSHRMATSAPSLLAGMQPLMHQPHKSFWAKSDTNAEIGFEKDEPHASYNPSWDTNSPLGLIDDNV